MAGPKKKTKAEQRAEKREELEARLSTGSTPEERRKAVLAEIKKKYGADSIQSRDKGESPVIERSSSGSISLDIALAGRYPGGYPKGRMVEIVGNEAEGKTTMCLMKIASDQKTNPDSNHMFIDMEHHLDEEFAVQTVGVDFDKMDTVQPDSGEDAIEMAKIAVRNYDTVIIDSIATMVPRAELDGSAGDATMGLHARLMSQACRTLNPIINSNCTLIWTNQWRSKIGVIMGDPRVPTGGNAMKFYASIRIYLKKGEKIKNADGVIGIWIEGEVVKNKTWRPFQKFRFPFFFKTGINRGMEIIEVAQTYNIVERIGTWFSYKGDRIGQGIDNASEFLNNNEDIANAILADIGEASAKVMEPPIRDEDEPEVED